MNTQVLLKSRPNGMVEIDNFEIKQSEIPALQEGQIMIRNHFISIDPAIRGWMNAGRTYIDGIEIGGVIRSFAVGEVIDSLNTNFSIGDWVEGLLGAQAYAIAEEKGLKKISIGEFSPSWYLGILGMPAMTAYFGLLAKGNPQEGETILISGAAGVVGTTVGQIAKIKGCRVVGIAGGQQKCQYLLGLGFDAVIDYKQENVHERLQEICPQGVHVFFDNVGGEILDTGLLHLARGARVVICGAISQYNDMANIRGIKNYMKLVTARANLTGIIVFDFQSQYPQAMNEISQWIREDKIKYKEQIINGLENFPKALQMLFSGENFGKLVIKV
jgi:hypothetical protein